MLFFFAFLCIVLVLAPSSATASHRFQRGLHARQNSSTRSPTSSVRSSVGSSIGTSSATSFSTSETFSSSFTVTSSTFDTTVTTTTTRSSSDSTSETESDTTTSTISESSTTSISTSSTSSSISSSATSTRRVRSTTSTSVVSTETPVATLNFAPTTFQTTATVEVEAVPTESQVISNVGAASTGFMNNKPAVAGTFTVVGLIVVALIILAVCFIMKRRRNRAAYDGDFSEKFTDDRIPSPTRSSSPAPGTDDLHYQVPMDPFHTSYQEPRQPVMAYEYYETQPSYSFDQEQYYTSPALPPPAQPSMHPATPPSQSHTQNNVYYNSINTGKLAPAIMPSRDPVARASYQPSIDSFYGAPRSPGQAT